MVRALPENDKIENTTQKQRIQCKPRSKQMKTDFAQQCFDLAEVIFVALDCNGCITMINVRGCELLGHKEDELLGQNWFETCLPDSARQEVASVFEKMMRGNLQPEQRYQNRIMMKSGEERLMIWQNTLLRDNDGQVVGTLSSGADITGQAETRQALRDSEAELRAVVEAAVDAIITSDERGIIQSANSAVERLFGFRPDELIGTPIRNLMPEPYRRDHDKYVANYIKTGKKKIIGIGREEIGQRKDGTEFPIRLSVSEFFVQGRRMFTALIHDISEQKLLQQRIIQSERLAVIGKMAAKVAHEVRNPLSSISLNAELLDEEISSNEIFDRAEAESLLQAMIREIDRVTSLTDEYLQFSRLPDSHPLEGNVNSLIRELLALLDSELSQKEIVVETNGLDRPCTVPFDRAQLRRVLLNIVRNAIESMTKGGKLKIWTEENNEFVVIVIQDSGVGIPTELVGNIFNPFFTTKDFGTGLGLAVSQQIVQEHRGHIRCESKVDEGTVFRISLPRRSKP